MNELFNARQLTIDEEETKPDDIFDIRNGFLADSLLHTVFDISMVGILVVSQD